MRRVLIAALALGTLTSFGQDENELDRRNGFKDIRVASPIDSVAGAVFKKEIDQKSGPPFKLYEMDAPGYRSIGEVAVDKIEIITYQGLVYTITVITEKDTRLMKGLQSALGPPEFNIRGKNYVWTGKNLTLTFSNHSKNKLELLYRSKKVAALMKEDQEKKIEKIANDF